jgi:hypothetical protein
MALLVAVAALRPLGSCGQLVESNCLAVAEVESVPTTGDWVYGSSIAGASKSVTRAP